MIPRIPILLFSAFIAFLAPALASSAEEPAGEAQRLREALEQLNLSDEQKEQAKAILAESTERRRAILEENQISEDDRRREKIKTFRKLKKELKSLQRETDAKMAAVLDEEQMAAYRQIRDELIDSAKKAAKERRAGPDRSNA